MGIKHTTMSTVIGNIQGSLEIPHKDMTVHYEDRVITVTSFSGGKQRGKSLQIIFLDDDLRTQHFQLSNEAVKELKEILINNFT